MPRPLRGLVVDGEPVIPGATVWNGDVQVGTVTSAARSVVSSLSDVLANNGLQLTSAGRAFR